MLNVENKLFEIYRPRRGREGDGATEHVLFILFSFLVFSKVQMHVARTEGQQTAQKKGILNVLHLVDS